MLNGCYSSPCQSRLSSAEASTATPPNSEAESTVLPQIGPNRPARRNYAGSNNPLIPVNTPRPAFASPASQPAAAQNGANANPFVSNNPTQPSVNPLANFQNNLNAQTNPLPPPPPQFPGQFGGLFGFGNIFQQLPSSVTDTFNTTIGKSFPDTTSSFQNPIPFDFIEYVFINQTTAELTTGTHTDCYNTATANPAVQSIIDPMSDTTTSTSFQLNNDGSRLTQRRPSL